MLVEASQLFQRHIHMDQSSECDKVTAGESHNVYNDKTFLYIITTCALQYVVS